MVTRISDMDEFDYFSSNFRRVNQAQPEAVSQLLATSFQPKHRDYLKTVLATKRIAVSAGAQALPESAGKRTSHDEEAKKASAHAPETQQVPRKIIKVKRRNAPQTDMADADFSV
jgi:hypothetical protein